MQGKRLKIKLVEIGWTQKDLADKTGIHVSTISRIVRGKAQATDTDKKAINQALVAQGRFMKWDE